MIDGAHLLQALTIVAVFICLVVLGLLTAMWGRHLMGRDHLSDDDIESQVVTGGMSTPLLPTKPKRGADPRASPHIVVDTLNLTHWLRPKHDDARLTVQDIIATIERTAPALKARYCGRVMYVVKDRDSVFNDEAARQTYEAAAKHSGVYVCVVERYEEPPAGTAPTAEHSAQGRDDFYLALLARRWRCAVLTEDRLKDFDRFRATVPPFHVHEYAFWRDAPHRESVRPDSPAYARLKKPIRVGYATVGLEAIKELMFRRTENEGIAATQ